MPYGDLAGLHADVVSDARAGLRATPKTLPAKLFYDEEGCRLFGEITRLPEYYLTRTEMALLPDVARDLAALLPPGMAVVEYGASDEAKALVLLDALEAPAAYVPIDIAGQALAALAHRLAQSRPGLRVAPLAGDFLRPLRLPALPEQAGRLGFFPGSTIGNLEPPAARRFLAAVRRQLGACARLLIGVDLRKDPSVLLPAYDDAAGVTAAFNRNLLHRLNREAAADFVPAAFDHLARWNAGESRIEMHLVSRCPQRVHLAGETIDFAAGESIHTENSYKHSIAGFRALAETAGWRAGELWTDPARLFSVHLLHAGEN